MSEGEFLILKLAIILIHIRTVILLERVGLVLLTIIWLLHVLLHLR